MSNQGLKSVFFNPRVLAMLFLGFSSGLPLALTGSTLQAWYTEANVNIVTIGFLSLIGLPYVWKFLWAPLMDRFSFFKGERRRSWIFVTQLSLSLLLFGIALFNPQADPKLMGIIALLIAFFSASQDIAIDAYRADVLKPEERGIGSAAFIFAYRIAMLASGGLALILADYFGWRFTYQLMGGFLLLSILATYAAPRPQNSESAPQNILEATIGAFKDLLKRDAIGLVLLFAVFYKIGDAFALTLISNFLLHGLGFSLTQVGIAYKTVGLAATILGAFAGGIWLVRLGLYKSLMYFGFAQAFSILTFMILAIVGKNFSLMVAVLFIENFCSAMGTTAFMAFLMSLCHSRYSATQYASLSALSAIGRVVLGPFAGVVVLHIGWPEFFAWAFVLAFPGLIILWLIKNKVSFHAEQALES